MNEENEKYRRNESNQKRINKYSRNVGKFFVTTK